MYTRTVGKNEAAVPIAQGQIELGNSSFLGYRPHQRSHANMNEEAADIWKRTGIAVGIIGSIISGIWLHPAALPAVELRVDEDKRQNVHEAGQEEDHGEDISEIKGDLKVIKDAVQRIERNRLWATPPRVLPGARQENQTASAPRNESTQDSSSPARLGRSKASEIGTTAGAAAGAYIAGQASNVGATADQAVQVATATNSLVAVGIAIPVNLGCPGWRRSTKNCRPRRSKPQAKRSSHPIPCRARRISIVEFVDRRLDLAIDRGPA